jgi:hypothetical protein
MLREADCIKPLSYRSLQDGRPYILSRNATHFLSLAMQSRSQVPAAYGSYENWRLNTELTVWPTLPAFSIFKSYSTDAPNGVGAEYLHR